ncbi:helix-turn-helix domain-containing protein [Cellulomonas biazotea]|uniref:HTH cro/C1-type domain-containing protein n=1 Tax=Cellulomonas biazotea TaxID=1709 RepID=A0A402DQG7_9CELL|nr:hypothetical protein CBZ_14350 [Cellulomonas biazotea]
MNTESDAWARLRSPADVGAFLRDARIEANLSQAALADELGFDRRVLQRIEAGEPTLYITRVFALLARLHLRLEVRGDGVPGPPPAPASDPTMPPWSITDRPAATHL